MNKYEKYQVGKGSNAVVMGSIRLGTRLHRIGGSSVVAVIDLINDRIVLEAGVVLNSDLTCGCGCGAQWILAE